MAKYKIIQDKENCIGCGACIAVCPENWEMKGNKANPKKVEVADIGCNQDAVDACPVSCIRIEKTEG